MGLSIALPFVLLRVLVQGDGHASQPPLLLDDGSPIWRCQSGGFLRGYPWTFLGFDIRFGRMTLNQAKSLDLLWNWVAGRGLQFFLAWIASSVHSAALVRIAEAASVPYGLFTSLALFSTSSASLWDLAKALWNMRGARMKCVIMWLLFSITYLAAVPSLLDVMSGYETSIRTNLNLPNETTLDTTDLGSFKGHVYYCVHGYSRPCAFLYFDDSPRSIKFYDARLNTAYYNLSFTNHDCDQNQGPRSACWRPVRFYTAEPENYKCVTEQDTYQWVSNWTPSPSKRQN